MNPTMSDLAWKKITLVVFSMEGGIDILPVCMCAISLSEVVTLNLSEKDELYMK